MNKLCLIALINLLQLILSIEKYKNMKSYDKYIRFEKILLKVQQSHPKDISRVHFKLVQQNGQVHKTKKYGTVNPTDIQWPCPIEFKYTAQPSFKFQTICEHQYGYQIQQLKALYCGQIHIKPEDFFIFNHFEVYNSQRQKCGKLSFMIKIVDREKGVKYNEQDQVQSKERIKVDLVARINFCSAKLQVHPLYIKDYQGKKSINPQAHVSAKIDDTDFVATQKDRNNWIFKGFNKFQLFEKSDDKIIIKILDGDLILLEGVLFVETILKNKRFLTQNCVMHNDKGIKIGALKIQMRIVEKKEILDLMYSPKKLQNTKMQRTDFDTEMSRIKLNETLEKKINSSEPILQRPSKRMSLDLKSKDMTFMKLSRFQSPQTTPTSKSKNKYDSYFKNQYQDMKFSQSKRFQDSKSNSPYISYTGQYDVSDFSPKRRLRGANFSRTQRTDFTKPFKNHPGTGDYHLPSIWQRS